MGYDFKSLEAKWQQRWKDADLYKCDVYDFSKPKCYIMDMFPYPSAQGLHVGHIEGYSATDAYSRYKRAKGFNVLHPMGFDSFGLPAEQYAIKNNKHPGPFTDANIDNFKKQMDACGLSIDWSKEVKTSDPSYYKWTQWIFLKLYENHLAYMDKRPVNYCPELGTVLANEEVIDGKSERGGFPVIQMDLDQWILKITAYADKLLTDLSLLDWPESTVTMQRNWIGRSTGVQVAFKVEGSDKKVYVYTTRVDTLFGCTYIVLAPENPLVEELTTEENKKAAEKYIEEAKNEDETIRTAVDKPKTGVFIGSYAINPINGRKVPIFIGSYVLATYGTGAVMAVPAHDERDYAFAKEHALPIIQVLEGDISKEAMVKDGKHINSSYADGLDIKGASEKITEELEKLGEGERKVNYKLRDWLFSRQRYWGEPIPIIHLENGKMIPVSYQALPLELPELDNYAPSGDGKPPLAKATSWVNVVIDGQKGQRETNIMPQWAGSSWYYIRYLDPYNEKEIADRKLLEHWLPVDLYIGGQEHAVLHLLYARFWHKFLYDLGIVKCKEPFKKLVHQGMVLGANGVKMSKSLGNVVNPNQCIEDFGADSLRLYELFKGPIEQSLPWSDEGLAGANRFLNRVYRLYADTDYVKTWSEIDDGSLTHLYNLSVKKISEDFENLRFNTAIAQMMIFVNALYQQKSLYKPYLLSLAQLIAPIAPHLGEELYELLGYKGFIDFVPWPTYDEKACQEDEVTLACMVNGKHKANIKLQKGEKDQKKAMDEALKEENVIRAIEGKKILKVIFVPDKIINFVIG
ncbi:MAG: leucine--tRNA ligase [Bacilli bacterium]|jgi:leucyl-tRNA synthetase|nr:leucine--tRNA ligase [Bacilli bacterium]